MPLPLINLDDRTYADLVEEAIALIPTEAPEWTDHNPSDTGIVLIELLAWLTEMVLYRANQIPDPNQAAFLSLLKGKPWTIPNEIQSTGDRQAILQAEIQKTLAHLRHNYRAVTTQDFQQLILFDWLQTRTAQSLGNAAIISRVHCLPERDLENSDINQIVEAHISLVLLPLDDSHDSENVRKTIKRFLNQRRLITTRIHVVEPSYVKIRVTATLYLDDSANFQLVQSEAKSRIEDFFDPYPCPNYWENQGYPFGEDIYISELYQLLDNLPGVDYVEEIQVIDFEEHRQKLNEQTQQLIGISLQAHELVKVKIGEIYTMQRLGDKWKRNN